MFRPIHTSKVEYSSVILSIRGSLSLFHSCCAVCLPTQVMDQGTLATPAVSYQQFNETRPHCQLSTSPICTCDTQPSSTLSQALSAFNATARCSDSQKVKGIFSCQYKLNTKLSGLHRHVKSPVQVKTHSFVTEPETPWLH